MQILEETVARNAIATVCKWTAGLRNEIQSEYTAQKTLINRFLCNFQSLVHTLIESRKLASFKCLDYSAYLL